MFLFVKSLVPYQGSTKTNFVHAAGFCAKTPASLRTIASCTQNPWSRLKSVRSLLEEIFRCYMPDVCFAAFVFKNFFSILALSKRPLVAVGRMVQVLQDVWDWNPDSKTNLFQSPASEWRKYMQGTKWTDQALSFKAVSWLEFFTLPFEALTDLRSVLDSEKLWNDIYLVFRLRISGRGSKCSYMTILLFYSIRCETKTNCDLPYARLLVLGTGYSFCFRSNWLLHHLAFLVSENFGFEEIIRIPPLRCGFTQNTLLSQCLMMYNSFIFAK